MGEGKADKGTKNDKGTKRIWLEKSKLHVCSLIGVRPLVKHFFIHPQNQHPNSIKLDIVKAMWYNVSKVVKESRATKTRPVQFINTCLCFGVMTIIKENEMSKVNSRLEMDIAQLLDYMWETEQTHYEEVKDDMQNPEQHIYMTMQRVRDAIWGELNEPSE